MRRDTGCRSFLEDLQRFGIKLGLENIAAVLSSFDHPERSFPSVLVAGTNGKGSVCAMLAEILTRSGLRVGLYTSPHLVRVEERIRVAGRLISEGDFCRLAGSVKRRTDRLLAERKLRACPTYFEVVTALAFLHFRERDVDIAVLEVGLGGRFDATNVVTPLVSVITNISRDHQAHLGRTIGEIAFEKAGIIKPGVPVICGPSSGCARRIIRRRAREERSPCLDVFGGGCALSSSKRGGRTVFRYRLDGKTFVYSPELRGEHQGRNAAVAIAAASTLSRIWRPLPKRTIIEGIEHARWEGRLEVVSRKPLILLDGAHNEAGASSLQKYVRGFLAEPPVVIFGIMKDKSIRRVAGLLFPYAAKVILTSIPLERAAEPAEVLALVPAFKSKIILEPSLKKAFAIAFSEAGRRGTILITGSLFLVGEAKKLLPRLRRSGLTPSLFTTSSRFSSFNVSTFER